MKTPKRFTLSTLLRVMLLVSLVFGYAQWRRQNLLREIKSIGKLAELNSVVSDHWFWPSVAEFTEIRLYSTTLPNASRVEQRLRDLGVKEILVVVEPFSLAEMEALRRVHARSSQSTTIDGTSIETK